jgi:NADPH:quinone reductase-like Zn-dependent oxidoreductase
MRLGRRILVGTLSVLALGIATVAIVFSYNSPCRATESTSDSALRMKAVVYRCYGGPEVLHVEEVPKPIPAANEVLVKVRAASVNPFEWHHMRGSPYIMRMSTGIGAPSNSRIGVDFSGSVEAVGASVTRFKIGDEVFGGRMGALAEFVTIREDGSITHKPTQLTFEQAAAIPIAGVTALQGLRDKGQLQRGQKVLINGASGGVGTFAVQIAKSFGAEVTGVCSTRNVELVRSIGADHVIDYTRENFTEAEERYDLIVDNVGNHAVSKLRGVLKPKGRVVIIGGPKGNWLGPLSGPIQALILSPFVDQELGLLLADMTREDLDVLGDLAQSGKMTPVIDRHYAFDEVRAAIAYLEEGRARGKVLVKLHEEPSSQVSGL